MGRASCLARIDLKVSLATARKGVPTRLITKEVMHMQDDVAAAIQTILKRMDQAQNSDLQTMTQAALNLALISNTRIIEYKEKPAN